MSSSLPDPREPFTRRVRVVDDRSVLVGFGVGALGDVGRQALTLGARVLLIAGRHDDRAADSVAAQLGASLVGRLRDVNEHVPVERAAEAVAVARNAAADALVAIGGGSTTGLAKAIALDTGLPILAVPTTYAGSEMTSIWGLTGPDGKTTGRDLRVLPRTVVYDPTLTLSLPPEITAASGMNAIAHAMESLYAPDTTEELLLVAERALATLAVGLPAAVARPLDLESRGTTLYGAWLAGWSLGSTTMGLHHKLAHVLGGTYRLSHAGVHSALLPQVAAFNCVDAPQAFRRAARALGVDGPERVAPALYDLAAGMGAPTSLAELGLDVGALPDVVATILASPATNPRDISGPQLLGLLHDAYLGSHP